MQGEGNPLNYRGRQPPRNTAYPPQLQAPWTQPRLSPSSSHLDGTAPRAAAPLCSNPLWSSYTLPAGRVLDRRIYPAATISAPPTIRQTGPDRVYSVLYSDACPL